MQSWLRRWGCCEGCLQHLTSPELAWLTGLLLRLLALLVRQQALRVDGEEHSLRQWPPFLWV